MVYDKNSGRKGAVSSVGAFPLSAPFRHCFSGKPCLTTALCEAALLSMLWLTHITKPRHLNAPKHTKTNTQARNPCLLQGSSSATAAAAMPSTISCEAFAAPAATKESSTRQTQIGLVQDNGPTSDMAQPWVSRLARPAGVFRQRAGSCRCPRWNTRCAVL